MKERVFIKTHGKVILAGEHGVVRGGVALVLPLRSRALELSWAPSEDSNYHVTSTVAGEEGSAAGPLAEPFLLALDCALDITRYATPHRGYRVHLASDIPVRAGLGSSAALSVAIVRFLAGEGARIENPFELALAVENLFHGKSSGIDVASVLSCAPIVYSRAEPPEDLRMAWRPRLYLSDTGRRSSTKECVAKVEASGRKDLDQRMSRAVLAARGALLSEQADRIEELGNAMDLAASCFDEWGLGASSAETDRLKNAGARSVKPTGSGGGGFLLSLWEKAPPAQLGLIPVLEDSAKGP